MPVTKPRARDHGLPIERSPLILLPMRASSCHHALARVDAYREPRPDLRQWRIELFKSLRRPAARSAAAPIVAPARPTLRGIVNSSSGGYGLDRLTVADPPAKPGADRRQRRRRSRPPGPGLVLADIIASDAVRGGALDRGVPAGGAEPDRHHRPRYQPRRDPRPLPARGRQRLLFRAGRGY